MEKDTNDEDFDFTPNMRPDNVAGLLESFLSITSTEQGVENLLNCGDSLLNNILQCTDYKVEKIARNATYFFINITATVAGARKILKLKTPSKKDAILVFVAYILDSEKLIADGACMILSNVTRLENEDDLEAAVDILLPRLDDILKAFMLIHYNTKGCSLDYIGPMFSNLSRSRRVRKWLTEANSEHLKQLLPFCNYERSLIRRGGIVGALRNLSFELECHNFLLEPNLDLLTYVLNPLMGNEEYADDEMDCLPITLQYLPKEKRRDEDADIRKMLIEILNRLCTLRKCRDVLRDSGVYYVLREHHKWERDPGVVLACEKVVDILIRKEEEIGLDDITAIEVPDEMKEKLEQLDEEFMKNFEI